MTRHQKFLLILLLILPALLFVGAIVALPFIFGMALLLAFGGAGAGAVGFVYFGQFLAVLPASAYNLLATAFIVSFLPVKRTRHLAFLPLSFALAIVAALPLVWNRIVHPPQIEQIVTRAIPLEPGTYVQSSYGRYPDGSLPIANPLESAVGIGWDEGCMCIYWTVADPYGARLGHDVSYVLGQQHSSAKTSQIVRVTVTGAPNHEDDRLLDITIDIHDGKDVTATLIERGVPAFPDAQRRAKRGELLSAYFVPNALSFVSHNTFWTPILDRVLAYYRHAEVRLFLSEALVHPT